MTRIRNRTVPLYMSKFPADVVAAAIAEDEKVQTLLRDARNRPPTQTVTENSAREGAAIMSEFRKASEAAMLTRIERKELITRAELVERLGGNRRWVSAALSNERLFSVQAPSGIEYYPAFFADECRDRRALGKVAKVLFRLPGASKYYFFVSKSVTLGMTPLEALAEGRVKDVLVTAAGFAAR